MHAGGIEAADTKNSGSVALHGGQATRAHALGKRARAASERGGAGTHTVCAVIAQESGYESKLEHGTKPAECRMMFQASNYRVVRLY